MDVDKKSLPVIKKNMEYFLYQTLLPDQTNESELGNMNLHFDDINILSLVVDFLPKITIKVLLIGESSTGKSSFVFKLKNNHFKFTDSFRTEKATHSFYTYKNAEFEFIDIPGRVYELNEDTYDEYYTNIDYILKFVKMNKVTFLFSYAWITRITKLLTKKVPIKSIVVEDNGNVYLPQKIHRISNMTGNGIFELLDKIINNQ